MEKILLEDKIMARVRRIHNLRKVFNPFMFKVYTLAAAFWGISSLVSIKNIFANMPSLSELHNLSIFTTNAFINTELSVQFILATALFVIVLLLRDAVYNLRTRSRLLSRQV